MKQTTSEIFRQICDLQGFFMKKGGFQIADVPYIDEEIGLNENCWNDEPTTEEVLFALDDIIFKLRQK